MANDPMDRLVEAMERQTAAMQELAESNRAVVDMLLAREADDMDDEAPSNTYLDGTPREL